MRCFLKGAVGAVTALIIFALTTAQYSDYTAHAETSAWMLEIAPLQKRIASQAEKNHTTVNSGLSINHPRLSGQEPPDIEITQDGSILLQGGQHGQLIVFIPTLKHNKVTWRCLVGPKQTMPRCNP